MYLYLNSVITVKRSVYPYSRCNTCLSEKNSAALLIVSNLLKLSAMVLLSLAMFPSIVKFDETISVSVELSPDS